MALKIRPYHAKDEKDVIDLWIACGLVSPVNNPKLDIERKTKVNPELFLVGEIEGKVIASCMAGYEGHRGWINYLAVHPDCRRRGFARRIMAEAERLLRASGCAKINLLVRSSNAMVMEFYKNIGFQMEDVICMGKRIEFDEPFQVE